jgi:hypothetical protein
VTTPLLVRRAILLFDFGYGIGKLVQVGAERGQEAQESVPADAAVAMLDLRDERGANLDSVRELHLRQRRPVAQCAQRATEGHVVTGGVVGGLDDLATFTDRLRCGTLDRPDKCPRAAQTAGGVAPRV